MEVKRAFLTNGAEIIEQLLDIHKPIIQKTNQQTKPKTKNININLMP